jgi:hypothetical protein
VSCFRENRIGKSIRFYSTGGGNCWRGTVTSSWHEALNIKIIDENQAVRCTLSRTPHPLHYRRLCLPFRFNLTAPQKGGMIYKACMIAWSGGFPYFESLSPINPGGIERNAPSAVPCNRESVKPRRKGRRPGVAEKPPERRRFPVRRRMVLRPREVPALPSGPAGARGQHLVSLIQRNTL